MTTQPDRTFSLEAYLGTKNRAPEGTLLPSLTDIFKRLTVSEDGRYFEVTWSQGDSPTLLQWLLDLATTNPESVSLSLTGITARSRGLSFGHETHVSIPTMKARMDSTMWTNFAASRLSSSEKASPTRMPSGHEFVRADWAHRSGGRHEITVTLDVPNSATLESVAQAVRSSLKDYGNYGA